MNNESEYDKAPDEDLYDEDEKLYIRNQRIWKEEHPWNQNDFI